MSIYGTLREDKILMTEEMYEYAIAESEAFLESEDEEIVDEGTNLDMRKKYNEAKRKYKGYVKQCKKYIKAHEYEKARDCVAHMRVIIDEAEYDIKHVDQDTESIVIGDVLVFTELAAYCSINILKLVFENKASKLFKAAANAATDESNKVWYNVLSVIFEPGIVSKAFAALKIIFKTTTTIMTQSKIIKRDLKEAKTEEDKKKCYNLYRNKVLGMIDDLRANVDQLALMIDYKEQSYNKKQENKQK